MAKTKAGEEAPKNESKHDKFKRLATARMGTVLQKLKVLTNCANATTYEWTPEEAQKIIDTLQSKIDLLKEKLLGDEQGNEEADGFSL